MDAEAHEGNLPEARSQRASGGPAGRGTNIEIKKQNQTGAMSMKERLYLAYGSNLNRAQMRLRCPGARVIGTAILKDWRLVFKGSKTGSYLSIEPAEGFRVPAAVWRVTESDEDALDVYEGFPTFYYKEALTVPVRGIRGGRERQRQVFAYIMQEDRPFGIPTARYLRICAEGYRGFGFNLDLLWEAESYSRKETELETVACEIR